MTERAKHTPGPMSVNELLAAFGVEDIREGSRAIGHDGPENDRWEDYIEVPIIALTRIANAIARAQGKAGA